MKISRSASFIAALAMAATGALALSQQKADASTVATVTSPSYARLYTFNGTLITNRALAPNTPWLVGDIINVNGVDMYQVSTNEYLKSSDSRLSGDKAQQQQQPTETQLIGTVTGPTGDTPLINEGLNDLSNNGGLIHGTKWVIGKYIVNRLGKRYVQVSSHDYVDASQMSFNQPLPEPISVPNFYYYRQMEPGYNANN